MSSLFKKVFPVILAGGAFLGASLDEARGQARPLPSYGQPSASTKIGAAKAGVSQITQGGTRPIGVGHRGPVGGYAPAVGGYYPGYGGVYMGQTPANGYLTGAADVISSQAEFMKAQQEADLAKEEVRRSQLDTRKKTFEEWKYEQAALPTAEELRVKRELADINRARGNPPLTEIRSGDALNILLADIQKVQGQAGSGPTVPLDPAMLRHINLTDGRSNSGVGLMRAGGKLEWPFPLEKEWFDADRKKTEDLLVKAVGEARTGRVSAKVIQGLLDVEESMRGTLKAHIHDLTPTHGVQARRYLTELHDTIGTLQDPNVSKYVGGAWTAKGDHVAELVYNMTNQGLKFAPAADGADSYYRAMYQALRTYDMGIAQLVSR